MIVNGIKFFLKMKKRLVVYGKRYYKVWKNRTASQIKSD